MEFFDKKEEVIEVQLTSFGRYKLSKGRMRPAYYAFFDDNIIYDSEYASFTEGQNSIEGRIQEDTPCLKSQIVYSGIETNQTRMVEILRTELEERQQQFTAELGSPAYLIQSVYFMEELQPVTDRSFFLAKPLGTSELQSPYRPSWNMYAYQGEFASVVTASADALTGSIPQINCTVKYDVYANRLEGYEASTDPYESGNDFLMQEPGATGGIEYDITNTMLFPNGTYLTIDREDLILQINENNSPFFKENFDIEIYMSSSATGIRQLYFENEQALTIEDHNPDQVSKYLVINADKEIPNEMLKKVGIEDMSALTADAGDETVISTREYLIKNLYEPGEEICE